MEIQAVPMAEEFLTKNKVAISDDRALLVQKIAKHIDALIFNISSLAVMVAMMEDKKKVEPRHLVPAQVYIAQQCVGRHASQKIVGGGIPKKGFVPEVEGFELNDNTAYMDLRSCVHRVIAFHKFVIGKEAMRGILTILHGHLGCLLKDIRACEPLTLKRMDHLLSLRRHSVFQ